MTGRRSWLWLAAGPLGLLAAAIAVLVLNMRGQVLHADPQTIPSAALAAPSPQWSEPVKRTRRMLRDGMAEQKLPGISVAVGIDGAVVWAEGFGWADIKTQTPVTPETRFRIGTASTVLTSAAAGILLQRGRFTLDDEIQKHVPQFPKKRWPVRLRHLMADTAGVGSDTAEDGPLFRERCGQPIEGLRRFADDPLLFEPATQYRPSKYGWILISAAVGAAADEPFLTFMHDEIFEPLGMDNTGAESATEENSEGIGEPGEDAPFITLFRQLILQPLGMGGAAARLATEPATIYSPGWGYDPLIRHRLHVMRPHNLSCYAGSLAFFSTPSDLVRFGLALNNGKLLQPDTAQLLQTSQRLASGVETGHGLGWELDAVTLAGAAVEQVGRDGELRGQRVVSLMSFRETDMVVAVMSNKANTDTRGLALKIAEEFARPVRN